MRKSVHLSAFSLLTLLTITLASCAPEKHTHPNGGVQWRKQLGQISFDAVEQAVTAYGEFMADNHPDEKPDAPVYWDIDRVTIDSVLQNWDQSIPGSEVASIRVYVGRKSNRLELILVPLVKEDIRSPTEVPVENTENMHNLIAPCPSTCGEAASNFRHFFDDVVPAQEHSLR